MKGVSLAVLCVCFLAAGVQSQELYRDWNRRVCPVLDTPYRTFRGFELAHTLAADTGTTGWGDGVSVTDLALWGRLSSWENDFGGELELRGHFDLRILEGMEAGSDLDRQYGLMMLRGLAEWHQRYRGGFGLQLRMQPGIYAAVSEPSGDLFSLPVGVTLVQAFSPAFALFAGVDYYMDFDVEWDPVIGLLYVPDQALRLQLAYPETRVSLRPGGGRFAWGLGAKMVRWPEYSLGSDDTYDRLAFEENQAYLELSWSTRGFTQMDLRAGYIFDREAAFADGPTVAFEDAPFIAIGFSALL